MRTLVIDAAALARNLDRLRRAASARIIGVVKGNGYGLGLTDYARFLTEHGVDMLAVSTAEEAAALRQAGMAYTTGQIMDLIANGFNHIHVYTMNKPEVIGGIRRTLSEVIKL